MDVDRDMNDSDGTDVKGCCDDDWPLSSSWERHTLYRREWICSGIDKQCVHGLCFL